MKSTASANANIALVKYWGKRDEKLFLPQNNSISMTCSGLNVITTVEFSDKYKENTAVLNNEKLEKENLIKFIDLIKEKSGTEKKVKIVSKSNFPIAAGLASSAAGYAALTLAASKSSGLNLNEKELSILARRGSGSASRSICEGFVEWYKGEKKDGSDSFAKTIFKKNHWNEFRMITAIVKETKKPITSRIGMSQTVKTSPYYKTWLSTIENDLQKMRIALREKNFTQVGLITEKNCLKMHKTMETTKPPIIYRIKETKQVTNAIQKWRKEIECYFTIDAGPNVKVICLEKDLDELNKRLLELNSVIKTIICKPGQGAKLINEHLF